MVSIDQVWPLASLGQAWTPVQLLAAEVPRSVHVQVRLNSIEVVDLGVLAPDWPLGFLSAVWASKRFLELWL